MPGVGVRGVGVTGGIGLTARIASLFRANEQGVWYDPSDRATLFQDAAGTTPVTALEQPVGLMLDKSGRGNHAFQSTSASRPVLSARVNLLTNTGFSGAVAGSPGTPPTSWSVVVNTGVLGAVSNERLTLTTSNTRWVIGQSITCNANTTYKSSFVVHENTGVAVVHLHTWDQSLPGSVETYYANGVVVNGNTYVPSAGDVITSTLAVSATGGTTTVRFGLGCASAVTGTVTIGQPDIRVANDGAGLPAYQRVGAATDYDTAGFPHYLKFDGVDDFLVTNSIDFTATDKMTVAAGVRTFASSAGVLAELSANIASSQGTFYLSTRDTGGIEGAALRLTDAPSSFVGYTPSTRPVTYVASIAFDASTNTYSDQIKYRANTTQIVGTDVTTATGPRNFTYAPLYIGRRGGASSPFNGRLYSLIVRGAASSNSQIASVERYINGKTKAYA